MPALRELMEFLCAQAGDRGVSFGEQCARELEAAIRRAYAGERVYIPPMDSRKDPARADAIKAASARLPSGVVAQRFGVSHSYVRRVVKK